MLSQYDVFHMNKAGQVAMSSTQGGGVGGRGWGGDQLVKIGPFYSTQTGN
jgi:hypothetical protein